MGLPLYRILLQAVAREANVAREYEITVRHDLLGDLVVETRWSRIGRRGGERRQVAPTEAEARRLVRLHLRERQGLRRRIAKRLQPLPPLFQAAAAYRPVAVEGDAWLNAR